MCCLLNISTLAFSFPRSSTQSCP
jgi:hypothetical protein